MKHGDIRPCFIMQDVSLKKNSWKLTENLRDKADRGQKLAFEAGTSIYVSPLAYKDLFGLQEQYEHDLHKSDVFSFGLCLLEAGLLKNIQDIYDSDHMEVNEQIQRQHIDSFGKKYNSKQLQKILIKCLSINEIDRPDWLLLKLELSNAEMLKKVNKTNHINSEVTKQNSLETSINKKAKTFFRERNLDFDNEKQNTILTKNKKSLIMSKNNKIQLGDSNEFEDSLDDYQNTTTNENQIRLINKTTVDDLSNANLFSYPLYPRSKSQVIYSL